VRWYWVVFGAYACQRRYRQNRYFEYAPQAKSSSDANYFKTQKSLERIRNLNPLSCEAGENVTFRIVRFDNALNLIWLSFGLLALLATVRSKKRRTGFQVLGVTLVVTALFPFISASDDLVRIEQSSRPTGANEHLVHLYMNLETPLAAVAPKVSFTLHFIHLVSIPLGQGMERSAPVSIGRSPPILSQISPK
jgi:hypothetical protein